MGVHGHGMPSEPLLTTTCFARTYLTATPVSLATLKARTANAMAHKLAVRVECYRVGCSDSRAR